MARRGDYRSFFGGRRHRDPYERRRSLLSTPVLAVAVVAALAVAGYAWFIHGGGPEIIDTGAPPVVLVASTTSTTRPAAGGTVFVDCPDRGEGWAMFQSSMRRSGCTDTERVILEPTVLWQTQIGIFGWLNNPVVAEGRVFIGSAGRAQFEGDRADGVYGVDLATGTVVWHFLAENDVNGVAYHDGIVVATGDEGRVRGIAATGTEQGRALWETYLGVSVFTNPLVFQGRVIVGDGTGEVTALDLYTGERKWRVAVAGPVRGGAASDGTRIYVISEEGGAAAIAPDGTVVWRQDLADDGGARIRVFAAPTVSGNFLVVPIVRDDLHTRPALIAIDRQTGAVRWRATDAAAIKGEWGNVRSSPALIGNLLVYGETYSSHLVAVDAATGETRWAVEAGRFCYPHWPSPAITTGQVILARHDGGLYSIDAGTGEVTWGIYVGDETETGEWPDSYEDSDFCNWTPKTGSPILSSPAIAPDGVVVVASLEGLLTAVGDATWGG